LPSLRLKRIAEDQLAVLPPHVRDEIDMALLRIRANPSEEGVPLLGRLSGRWRKRVGGYRIIYRIRDGGRLVIVDAIRPRGEAC
jgi:mRNA-degrading endonuclease RelE of RelBE toxin-antitoxin system